MAASRDRVGDDEHPKPQPKSQTGEVKQPEDEESVEGLTRKLDKLTKLKAKLEGRIEQLRREDAKDEVFDRYKRVKGQVKALKAQLKALLGEAERAGQGLKDGDHKRLKQLRGLMSKNEALKKKEAEFRVQCKVQREQLVRRNEDLGASAGGSDAAAGSTAELEGRLADLRTELAGKSMAVSDLERQLDQVPSAYELQQYQRRFFELDSQVSAEFSATQQFVTMFNTLVDQKSFMEKAVGLLEAILDVLPDPRLSSSQARAQFVDKLSRLMQSIDQVRSMVNKSVKDQEGKKSAAVEELNRLLEEQRAYALLVRDMREEMKKNEILSGKVSQMA